MQRPQPSKSLLSSSPSEDDFSGLESKDDKTTMQRTLFQSEILSKVTRHSFSIQSDSTTAIYGLCMYILNKSGEKNYPCRFCIPNFQSL
jgi:hypothetical protein